MPLHERQIIACALVVDGLTEKEICEREGIAESTLSNWKRKSEFIEKCDEIRNAYAQAVRLRGIAVREKRVAQANQRHQALMQIVAERANDPDMQRVPGGKTGYLVRDVKQIGKGADAERIELFTLDVGLLNELRQIEKQVAQDLGQWTLQHQIQGQITHTHGIESALAKVYGETNAHHTTEAQTIEATYQTCDPTAAAGDSGSSDPLEG